jgi:hypothetical protein
MPAKIAMMAITTRSSIRVKAGLVLEILRSLADRKVRGPLLKAKTVL